MAAGTALESLTLPLSLAAPDGPNPRSTMPPRGARGVHARSRTRTLHRRPQPPKSTDQSGSVTRPRTDRPSALPAPVPPGVSTTPHGAARAAVVLCPVCVRSSALIRPNPLARLRDHGAVTPTPMGDRLEASAPALSATPLRPLRDSSPAIIDTPPGDTASPTPTERPSACRRSSLPTPRPRRRPRNEMLVACTPGALSVTIRLVPQRPSRWRWEV